MAAPLPAGEAAALTREAALPDEEKGVRKTLEWIGFPHAVVRERITAESFTTYGDIQALKEADITSLANSFTKRTPANSRIQFGQRRIKRLKSLIHWSQDFRRVSLPVSVTGLDATIFKDAIEGAARQEEIRALQIDTQDQVLKQASPGKLVSEAKWNK